MTKTKVAVFILAAFISSFLFSGCAVFSFLANGKIGIYYPDEIPVVDIDKKLGYIDGWIIGYNTENAMMFIKGTVAGIYFDPKRPFVYAQAENYSPSMMMLVKGTGAYAGTFVYEGFVPVSSPGKAKVVLKTLKQDDSPISRKEFDVYSVGFYSPEHEHGYAPQAEFYARADKGTVNYFGPGNNISPASMLNGFDMSKGRMPESMNFKAEPGAIIKLINADGTPCEDFEFGTGEEFQPLGSWTVPPDGFFRLRLKPVYKGKSYIPILINTETSDLKKWKVFFGAGAKPAELIPIQEGWRRYGRFNPYTMGYLNVSDKKMYGDQTLMMEITESRYGYKDKEIDRSVFSVGYHLGKNGREYIKDAYGMFTLWVPAGKTKESTPLVIYSGNENPPLFKDSSSYKPVTPVYEPCPSISGSVLADKKRDIELNFYITEQHLIKDGRKLEKSSLVICREYKSGGGYAREIIKHDWKQNVMTALAAELDGYYYVINKEELK